MQVLQKSGGWPGVSGRVLANLLLPPFVIAVLTGLWKIQTVQSLPTGSAIAYQFALLLPAWLIAEALNALLKTVPRAFAPPKLARYMIAALPVPLVTGPLYRTLHGFTFGDAAIAVSYPDPSLSLEYLSVLLPNWLPGVMLWVGYKLLMDEMHFGLSPDDYHRPTRREKHTPISDNERADERELPPVLQRAGFTHMPELYALQAQEHYVLIHSSAGQTLVRYRISDAAKECAHLDGLRVHRSWWVLRRAMGKVTGRGRTLAIELPNGETAPVSLSSKQAVLEARANQN